MPLEVVGVSHRTAPIEVRERFAFARTRVAPALRALREGGVVSEAVLLSTCNRTELYFHSHGETGAARRFLLEHAGVEVQPQTLFAHRDRSVAKHLFRVAAGLDSMVVGEPQIQGQVKEAYHHAREVHAADGPVVGPVLNRLFQQALSVGGRVRSRTQLGIGAASVPSAAVELAKKIFGSLEGRRALIVGAGEMSEVTLECLRSEGVVSAVVANRSYERAREISARWGGRAVRLDDFAREIAEVDIVVCSTAAPHPVLTAERFAAAFPTGAPHPLCILDLALPRDVDPALARERNVFLYNLDDLRGIVDQNLDRRRVELPAAEQLVSRGVEEFWSWYGALAVVPTIRDLRDRGEDVRRAEVERLLGRLRHLSSADRAEIEVMTRSLLGKLLHGPTVRLREAVGNGRGTSVIETARYLFELDPDHPDGASPAAPVEAAPTVQAALPVEAATPAEPTEAIDPARPLDTTTDDPARPLDTTTE
jgi:glutamyl-tRNA reductase